MGGLSGIVGLVRLVFGCLVRVVWLGMFIWFFNDLCALCGYIVSFCCVFFALYGCLSVICVFSLRFFVVLRFVMGEVLVPWLGICNGYGESVWFVLCLFTL